MEKIKILIADNHRLFRQSWSIFLDSDPRLTVVGEANCGEEAINLASRLLPQIVLIDIHMPGMDVVEIAKLIFFVSPKSKIICVSPHSQSSYATKMINAGARGFITKYSTKEEFLSAIIEVHNGNMYMCSPAKENNLTNDILNKTDKNNNMNTYSKKELELIWLVKKASSSDEITKKVVASIKTNQIQRQNFLKKFNLTTRAALVNFFHNYYC